jgi:hypothetical protein
MLAVQSLVDWKADAVEGIDVACHLRKTPEGYVAVTGAVVTLFAEHYDAHPQGLPTDYWVNDSNYSFQFAAHPKKGGVLACLNATYGDKKIIQHSHAKDKIQFTVQPGRYALKMLFNVGNSPYESGRLVEDCGDGETSELCGMSAEYPVAEITITGKP